MARTTRTFVCVYLDSEAARGCGHMGILYRRADGSYRKYWQSAANTDRPVCNLLLLNNPMRILREDFPKHMPFYTLTRLHQTIRVPEVKIERIDSAVEAYRKAKPQYNSLTNNCAHFVAYVLNHSSELKFKSGLIPNRYFYALVRQIQGFKAQQRAMEAAEVPAEKSTAKMID